MDIYTEPLYDKELMYQASILRKCTKLYKETALTIHNLLVDKLKEKALNPDTLEIEDIFKREFN